MRMRWRQREDPVAPGHTRIHIMDLVESAYAEYSRYLTAQEKVDAHERKVIANAGSDEEAAERLAKPYGQGVDWKYKVLTASRDGHRHAAQTDAMLAIMLYLASQIEEES